MVEIGFRVVRGPDWKWNDQDGGDGHVGTVVEVGRAGTPEKTVIVQWDNGRRTNYRVGYRGAYDLLVFDGAPAGVKHFNKRCDGCGRRGIKGIRWQCTQCSDYDLCTKCYMDNVHDIQHKFRRFLTSKSTGVLIPKPRSKTRRSQSSGIFPGAKVIRGCDWIWGDQDGGNGGIGTVTEIRGWQNESENSVASVSFPDNRPNVYRVGHRGKVDLKYSTPSSGPSYYKEHLPVLGKDDQVQYPFKVGDRVKVSLAVDVLEQLQRGHGGWNPKMADLIDQIGVVHRITQAGDVRVQYPIPVTLSQDNRTSSTSSTIDNNRWTINPAALAKVPSSRIFAVNDQVRVIEDAARVKSLQSEEHGNWNEKMMECLGQTGRIFAIYSDGDVRVEFSAQRQWTFNPACLIPEEKDPANATLAKDLISKAALGNFQGVEQIILEHPTMVNAQCRDMQGSTALHVAAYKGRTDIVRFLLSKGANISMTDNDDDGALHFAMASKASERNECMRILLEKATAADVNLLNAKRQSPLHAAVIQNHKEWAMRILHLGCDINTQDSEGDTAAHCCVTNHDDGEMMRLLLAHPKFNPTLVNSNDFNILHRAAVKGRLSAVEAITERFPDMALSAKSDGLTALHLSVLNKHEDLSKFLIEKFPQLIDKQDNSGQTPLYVAASEGDIAIVAVLVAAGAAVHVVAADGKTCVHAALEKFNCSDSASSGNPLSMDNEASASALISSDFSTLDWPTLPEWREIGAILCHNGFTSEKSVYLGIACYLLTLERGQEDDDVISSAVNLLKDEKARAVLREYKKKRCMMKTIASDFTKIVNLEDPPRKLLSSPLSRRNHDLSSFVPNNFVKCLNDDVVDRQDCVSCGDEYASVEFRPCGHRLVCVECCVRMKRCVQCKSPIESKVDEDGTEIPTSPSISQQGQVQVLERKVRELQESNQCIICMENQRDTALKCGHRFCQTCAQTLRKHCPICRKPITGTIHLYN